MRRFLVACVVALVAGVAASLALASGSAPPSRWVLRNLGTLGGSSSAVAINDRGRPVRRNDILEQRAAEHEALDGLTTAAER